MCRNVRPICTISGKLWTEISHLTNTPSGKLWSETLVNFGVKYPLLRPFYFWCLNKIINEADGALMEYVGEPARRYIEKFPSEFIVYLEKEIINEPNWKTAINYSGYYDNENTENKKLVAKTSLNTIENNCNNCSSEELFCIKNFINDCFKE